ncbi:hypothetical protein [Effusibacillus pohliae]|uniref:hypothetical protein n=1 Tax=Effusibacillus pohliae TaxID=232270 RepID=UPI0003615CB8|nr:hypothetical protein [Effusibacillus pohliae]
MARKYIANCLIHEGSRIFQKGDEMMGVDPERMEKMTKLPGWNGEPMVIVVDEEDKGDGKTLESQVEDSVEKKSGRKK